MAASPRNAASPRCRRIAHRPSEREQRRQPPEEDELLDAGSRRRALTEVGELGRVALDLRERAAAAGDRACDHEPLDRRSPAAAAATRCRAPAFHQSERGTRAHAYPSASTTAPIAR